MICAQSGASENGDEGATTMTSRTATSLKRSEFACRLSPSVVSLADIAAMEVDCRVRRNGRLLCGSFSDAFRPVYELAVRSRQQPECSRRHWRFARAAAHGTTATTAGPVATRPRTHEDAAIGAIERPRRHVRLDAADLHHRRHGFSHLHAVSRELRLLLAAFSHFRRHSDELEEAQAPTPPPPLRRR